MLQHQFAFIGLDFHQALIDDDRRILLFAQLGDGGLLGGRNMRG
jgi:hypothetical protein